jgi:hypothetical protein
MNEPTDFQVEVWARAGHEYRRAKRPSDHGPYDSWEELDEGYREYLRGIQRAALSALMSETPEGTTPV